jgi:hypothetical protein
METVLLNLLRYVPVEGSIGYHEAWKQNVLIVSTGTSLSESVCEELRKPGYVSGNCRRLIVKELRRLTSEIG